jgi:5'-nucleotidase
MAWSPDDSLVIGISSRALFDLDQEDKIFREQGTVAFIEYQRSHEDEIIERGVAFPLIEALLGLNTKIGTGQAPAIEVVIVSKNHPDCAIRIWKSLKHYGLSIKRAALTGGQSTLPYLHALKVGLFLSKEEEEVKEALAAGVSAGLVFGAPVDTKPEPKEPPVIAFDGDAVLFSDESDRVYKEQKLEGFAEYERTNASVPMEPGPLRKFAHALSELRTESAIDAPPFRIALVTARDLTYCERPIRTLRAWGLRMDQAFFVSNMSKRIILAALNPLIFFDDNTKNCQEAAVSTPTVQVPAFCTEVIVRAGDPRDRPLRFTTVCKLFLKTNFEEHEKTLLEWHEAHLSEFGDDAFEAFVTELERSARTTPRGRQRRSAKAENSDLNKLLLFLENMVRKQNHG